MHTIDRAETTAMTGYPIGAVLGLLLRRIAE
jgi:hypothetical protein